MSKRTVCIQLDIYFLSIMGLIAAVLIGTAVHTLLFSAHAQSPEIVLVDRKPDTSWVAVHASFNFTWRYPETIGRYQAEDKTGDPAVLGYKMDVWRAPACARWSWDVAPILTLTPKDSECQGGTWLDRGIYIFDYQSSDVPPSSTHSPEPSLSATVPPASSTPPPGSVTATPIIPTPYPTWAYPSPTPVCYQQAVIDAVERGEFCLVLRTHSTPLYLPRGEDGCKVVILVDVGDTENLTDITAAIIATLNEAEDWQVYGP